MRDQYLALYELQQLDSRVLEIDQSAAHIPRKIGEIEEEVDVLRSKLGGANTELQTLKKEASDLEGTATEETAKHKHWKRRLNDIKNSREYQALSREIEQGERQVRDLEDKLLELTETVETRQKAVDDQEAELKQRESEVRAKVQELRSAQSSLRDEAEKAKHGREELAQKVNPRVLKKYEKLRVRTGGIAVAVVRDGACSGCNMQLRPQQVVELLRATSWQSCPNCHRMLIHENQIAEDNGDN
ncbi:MAG: C4-type zinc ribbon domain-containing protein [Myxococcota bacterium]